MVAFGGKADIGPRPPPCPLLSYTGTAAPHSRLIIGYVKIDSISCLRRTDMVHNGSCLGPATSRRFTAGAFSRKVDTEGLVPRRRCNLSCDTQAAWEKR